MVENQVYGLQILTFLVKQYGYQIVNIKGLSTTDYWLVNIREKYPLVCITSDTYTEGNILQGTFGQVYRALLTTFTQLPKCLVINTSEMSEKFEHDQIIQIPVKENQPIDHSLSETFNGIDQVVRKVEDISKEKRNLKKSLQKTARDRFYSAMKEKNKGNVVTFGLFILCFVIFLGTKLLNSITNDEIVSAIIAGAYYKMSVVGANEYWRLLTAGFVHTDIWHLFVNMMALFSIGNFLERQMKRSHYITVILVSIIAGNFAVMIGDGNIVGLGISGALYGLLGVYTVLIFSSGAYKNPRILNSFTTVLAMNLIVSLLPNISMLGHLGGFIAGVVLGICFSKQELLMHLKKHVIIASILVLVGCGTMIPRITRIQPVYGGTDAKLIYSLQEMNLNSYAKYLLDSFNQQIDKQGDEGYREIIFELIEMERNEE